MSGRTVLITGGNSGFGKARLWDVSEHLVCRPANVVPPRPSRSVEIAGRYCSLCGRANLGTVNWLVVSLVLSVVLTVVANIVLRLFPGSGDRIARSVERLATSAPGDDREGDRRVRVIVPWKAMIVGSVVLTIVVNLVLWLR